MREIKFRAWSETKKKIGVVEFLSWGANKTDALIRFDDRPSLTNVPNLMQFTGMRDCNGTEIWEGDIIYIDSDEAEDGGAWTIEYLPAAMQFVMTKQPGNRDASILRMPGDPDLRDACVASIKVIGNIYENPDLLREPDDQFPIPISESRVDAGEIEG